MTKKTNARVVSAIKFNQLCEQLERCERDLATAFRACRGQTDEADEWRMKFNAAERQITYYRQELEHAETESLLLRELLRAYWHPLQSHMRPLGANPPTWRLDGGEPATDKQRAFGNDGDKLD